MNCTTCGNPIQEGMQFCMNCGAPAPSEPPVAAAPAGFCMSCGAQLEKDMAFCIMCGAPIVEESPTEIISPLDKTPVATAKTASAPVQQQSAYAQPAPAQQQSAYVQPAPAKQQSAYVQPAPAKQQAQPVYTPQPAPTQGAYAQHGSSVQTAPAPAQSQTPRLQHQAKPKKKSKKGPIIAIIIVVIAIVAAVVGGIFTNWYGIPDMINPPAPEVSITEQVGLEPKDTVESYSWDELSTIANAIAAADSDEAGLEIAKTYNLVNADGKLDGTQVKSLKLDDTTRTAVQIVGFRQDKVASGGYAGITFVFEDAPYDHAINNADTNEGGWKNSNVRSWLNDDVYKSLPSDLSSHIVEVSKKTNNKGQSSAAADVTETSDKLWLLSAEEITGGSGVGGASDAVINAEGVQYKLYKDLGVGWSKESDTLKKVFLAYSATDSFMKPGEVSNWWLRTPDPRTNNSFFCVYHGSVYAGGEAHYAAGIAPGFCI